MCFLVRQSVFVVAVLSLLVSRQAVAWSPTTPDLGRQQPSRQDFVRALATGIMTVATTTSSTNMAVAATTDSSLMTTLQEELKDSRNKLQEIPALLQAQEWDKVRSILKTPPVNKLWNLGDSQNTVLKLAKETGDVELFELKDELAYNLQMCDQLTYDNVFVYFQPGSGKIKIKEPTDSANKAMAYLDQILDATK